MRLFTCLLLLLLAVAIGACDQPSTRSFTILSGSENKSLEPIVDKFCKSKGWQCLFRYEGSVDIKLALEQPDLDVDAVWPAHSRWIELGDRARRVKSARSIMTSPVVFGVRDRVARQLNLKDRPVSTPELVDLVRSGKLKFLMTSATQSNSGFAAYIGMLSALAGSPEVLDLKTLNDKTIQDELKTLLAGVERSAGSSGWLKDLYLEGARQGLYQAMVNYEAVIIEANQALVAEGREPLYLIYPADGTAIADSPLGFVSRPVPDAADREAFFNELQAHLLSPAVQRDILALGRRIGIAGQLPAVDPTVFNPAWGIDVTRPLPATRFPETATLLAAMNLYQETLRKPSLLTLCLDYSGSMAGDGEQSLERAIADLFDPAIARRYLLQPAADDVFVVLAFSDEILGHWVAKGPKEAAALPQEILATSPGGGTDIYQCIEEGIRQMRARPEWATHLKGVIVMTDGRSQGDAAAFGRMYVDDRFDVPVFGITFGDADTSQLKELATLTRARVFDGQSDLQAAFRTARGYN